MASPWYEFYKTVVIYLGKEVSHGQMNLVGVNVSAFVNFPVLTA